MNKVIKLIILIQLLLSLVNTDVLAKVSLLNEESGLSNVLVLSIAKDSKGNLWIGTQKGLNKYDGYVFNPNDYFKKQTINSLLFDSIRDYLWIGTEKGLYYLNCKNNKITYLTPFDSTNSVVSLLENKNEIIVGFRHKYILKIAKDFSCKVICYFHKNHLIVNRLTKDYKNNIYALFSDNKTFIKINLLSSKIKELEIDNFQIVNIVKFFDNEIYVGLINRGLKTCKSNIPLPWYIKYLNSRRGDPEYAFQEKNKVYIGYRNPTKVYEVNIKDSSIINLSNNSALELFSNKRIHCMFKDEFDVIWIGTSKGLLKYTHDDPKPIFDKLLFSNNKMVSTREIIEDEKGNLYVASYSGLNLFDKALKKWYNFNEIEFENKKCSFWQRTLLNVSKKYIYIGSDANYFVRFDKTTRKFSPNFIIPNDTNCWKAKTVLSMDMDINGKVWLGTDNGLVSIDTNTNRSYCHINDKFNIGNTSVRKILMLPNKMQFWAGTENGIFLVDIFKGIILHLNEYSTPALSSKMINSITRDFNGNFWIGSDDAGIDILNNEYNYIYNISRKDGLSSNEVYNILCQDSSSFWISTYNGLNYYNSTTKLFVKYMEKDGITNNEFNQNSAFKGSDGRFYFGSINGITSFYPKKLNFYHAPYNIFLSSITKWEKKKEEFSNIIPTDKNNKIEINPGDNLLSFSFAINDYNNTDGIVYFYIINEVSNDWIPLASNSLRLESLQPGNYTLQVKAVKGTRGIASANILKYNLAIIPFFYQTVWFYMVLSILIVSIVFFYFSINIRNLKKLELLRVKIASNLHDEVGSLLTRITMSADVLHLK